ncbi:hypothetical protein L1987_45223 [Smallanthus sonchifolius]|uniref:Uncharacterized protein n=1 Tax=Smallanthus sonchifolius TaxID=185202 RepID=A0ACB9GSA7_9ASTR|nr:hypothetical protein L1987_45223 [Smallanthus sonchifolius]
MKAFNAAVLKAMEVIHSETASPALSGFGRSPVVRQLRVTDSPFPVNNVDEDNHVDEAAERFISRFYNDLRRQKRISGYCCESGRAFGALCSQMGSLSKGSSEQLAITIDSESGRLFDKAETVEDKGHIPV